MKNDDTKSYLVVSTEKSVKTTPKEVEECRLLFNNNPTVKNLFKNNINKVLKEVFHQHYKNKDEYSPGESYGIYDLEMSGRSVINKLNTNYSAFSVLLRDINKVLSAMQQPIIVFNYQSSQNQILQVHRLNHFIDLYKNRIFDTNSATFQTIMFVLSQTHAWGQKREDNTIVLLKKQFGEKNVKPIGKLGSSQDMIGGIDTIIEINGNQINAQIKPFTHLLTEDNLTHVMGAGNVKKYKTDWIIFSKNNKEILVFDNKNSKIVDGNFVFNKENLIYTLS
jgi:hypothetical protein